MLVSDKGRKCSYLGRNNAENTRVAIACSDVVVDVVAMPKYYFEVYIG